MLKRTLIYFTIVCAISLLFTTCRRYPEGGWTNVAKKHLFGGHQKGSSKTWHLKKYEVNGIDSTAYIIPGNGVTTFENDEYTFRIDQYSKNDYYGKSKAYVYTLVWGDAQTPFENSKKEIGILVSNAGLTREEQCNTNSGICERNIFNPNFNRLHLMWKIIRLTNNSFIISTQDEGNKYIITLTH
jgi:hypothetical protein